MKTDQQQETRAAKTPRGIFERTPGSGTWWIRYVDNTGRLHREKAGSKSSAIKLYGKRKQEVLEGAKLPELRRRVIRFSEIADDALEYSRTSGRHGKRTQVVFRQQMRRLTEWFGDRDANSITAEEIERELADHSRTPATFNRWRSAARLVYRLAIKAKKVAANPARDIEHRKESKGRLRFLSEGDEARLRIAIRRLYPERESEFDLGLYTGMRRSEQYGIHWSDVDLHQGVITIQRAKHGGPREVQINSRARAALEKLWEYRHEDSNPVCPGGMGRNGYVHRWFFECVAAAGIEGIVWHSLRHTYVSRLVQGGVNLKTVKDLAGHLTIQTTDRYAHLYRRDLQQANERLCDAAQGENPTGTRTDTSRENATPTKERYLN